MKNYIQKGEVINYSNSGSAIASGDTVVIGALIGIAQTDIAATTGTGSVCLEGVFEVAKTTSLAIAQGDRVYWNTSTKKVTKTTSDVYMGVAFEAAGSSDTTCLVSLNENGAEFTVATTVAALTDNTGGATANGTLAAIASGTPATLAAQGTINGVIADNFADLAAKQNEVIAALKAAGLMA